MDNCQTCNGTGLIPFVKNGKVIPNVFTFCACHPIYGDNPELERYHQVGLADWDFPCSDTFRSYSYQYCSQPDPGYVPPEPEPPLPQVIEHRHSDMSKKEFDLLKQTALKVNYLETKLSQHLQPKEKRASTYKGLAT